VEAEREPEFSSLDDAEKFIQAHDHDGGSWYLEVQTGKVYTF